MSNSEEGKGMSTIPKWDGKDASFSRWSAKLTALAELHDCGDAFDKAEMRNCPTRSEYEAFDMTNLSDADKKKVKLYKANKKVCAMLILGQESDHGLAAIEKTKTSDHPHGVAWKVVETMMAKHKPNDASAEIQLDTDLNAIQFKCALTYYNDITAVLAKYNVAKSETDVIKIMAKKVGNSTFANLIITHLNSPNPDDLEELCNEISAIQRLTRTTGAEKKSTDKEVSLASTSGSFKGPCNRCKKFTGFKAVDCPCKNNNNSGSGGGGGNNNNVNTKCNHCGGNHKENRCWKKHPEKAPTWYKEKSANREASNADIEITMAQLNLDQEQDFCCARL